MYSHPAHLKAMCQALHPEEVGALCFELPGNGEVPEWVELIPAGPDITGRDGRSWTFDMPEEVIAASKAMARDLALDFEHSTELKAPKGEEAPAAAWITDLDIRNGALWGKVDWNERGREAVANREYRYLSPVFDFERASKRIVRLTSAGLTNTPNLHLQALNRGTASPQPKETTMSLSEKIRLALGLGENATEDDAETAINTMKSERDTALNRAETPSLDKFVPRADYDTALNRATTAEQALADSEKEKLDAEIETAINQALEDGKITPATADYHREQCRAEGGLERFQKYADAAPVIADSSDLDGKKKPEDQGTALNAEEQRIASMFGNSAEDLQKFGTA